jgi:hypothetical protein
MSTLAEPLSHNSNEPSAHNEGHQSHFTKYMHRIPRRPTLPGQLSSHGMNWGIPSLSGAMHHVSDHHGERSWRYRVIQVVHSSPVQLTLTALLILDVLILFIELYLLATFPHCTTIVRDALSCCPVDKGNERFLAGDNNEENGGHEEHNYCDAGYVYEYEAACNEHKYPAVHTIEEVLFSITIMILGLFFIELNLSMITLKPTVFFRQLFYLLDYFIVTVSLVLELTFHFLKDDLYQSLAGLLVLIRIWRFVRIGHGIVEVVAEMSHEKHQKLLAYTEELENLLKKNQIIMPERSPSINHMMIEQAGVLGEVEKDRRQQYKTASSHNSHHNTNSDRPIIK